jgi:signal transduction histidine kinase
VNRRSAALRLALIVAFAGLVPIAATGVVAVEILRRKSVDAAQDSLRDVAEQAAARIGGYLAMQKETLRAVAAATAGASDAARRLEEVPLDARSLRKVALVGPSTDSGTLLQSLTAAQVAEARGGKEVASAFYLSNDLTPAMEVCVPAPGVPSHAVCAVLDLLELWRYVHRIQVGESGYALCFDSAGKLLASGAGVLRANILTGESVPQSAAAVLASREARSAPRRYDGAGGVDVLAGWARIPGTGWVVGVEQPSREALRAANAAQWVIAVAILAALLLSLGIGIRQSRRMLAALEVEERWRTAGRIASGITHDLGHRLAILKQTAALAEAKNPEFLGLIHSNLTNEIGFLGRFVSDFADLSRVVSKPSEMLPMELNALVESVARTATAQAVVQEVRVEWAAAPEPVYVNGDHHLLQRAVLNLVSNAIDASAKGKIVRLRVGIAEGVGAIEVVDEGAGIPPERVEKLFDAFESTKRTGAHIGMGLANVKRITAAHGGTATVTSAVGKGSTFRISLPRLAGPAPGGATR